MVVLLDRNRRCYFVSLDLPRIVMNTLSAIEINGLSKLYRIGQKEGRSSTLAGTIAGAIKAPVSNFRRLRSLTRFSQKDLEAHDAVVWALQGVDLVIPEGEILGVIGKNGAGKSTLLKVLSGITKPTVGAVHVRGRVASLLEVGTGFHPELTGRENVYLNGTILGMKRHEIDRQFDDIVEFAGVRRFLDTPVKWYSSGMTVRLAFSVAAHLEADILLIDEVLAVGDAAFQKKCLQKMGSLTESGRTVVFVSHNMAAVTNICRRVIRVHEGRVVSDGTADEVVQEYLGELQPQAEQDLTAAPKDRGPSDGALRRIRIVSGGVPSAIVQTGGRFQIEVDVDPGRVDFEGLSLTLRIFDSRGQSVLGTSTSQYNIDLSTQEEEVTVVAGFKGLALSPGTYTVTLFLGSGFFRDFEIVSQAIAFSVAWPSTSERCTPPHQLWGPMFVPVDWTVRSR